MIAEALYIGDAEVAILGKWLRDLEERGRAILIGGEAGIGKTALLAATAVAARSRRCRVLTTVGVDCEAHLPFAGLRPVLARADGLPPPQRAALLRAARPTRKVAGMSPSRMPNAASRRSRRSTPK